NNDFDSSTVVANNDGSLIERLEYIITSLSALWTKSGNDLYYTTGNVGVGTTTPNTTVHISANTPGIVINDTGTSNGSIRFRQDETQKWGLIRYANESATLANAFTIYQFTDQNDSVVNQYRMVIDDDGNIGIGTSAPAAPFDVTSNVADNSMVAVNSNATGYGPFFQGGGGATSNYIFYFRDKDGSSPFYMNGDGNVGVGTTVPSKVLDVSSTSSSLARFIHNDGAGAWVTIAESTDAFQLGLNSGKFQIYDNDPGAYRFTIDTSGNIGIGTANPTSNLHVVGNTYVTSNLGVGDTPSSSYGLKAYKAGTNTSGIAGISIDLRQSSASSGTYYNYALNVSGRDTISSGQTNSGYMMGANISGYAIGPGTIGSVYGMRLDSGTLTTAGTITNLYGAYVRLLNQASGTITNASGVYVTSSAYSGSMTNVYGVRIGNMAGTNDYGIYQEGSNDDNYFAGNVGIGTTAPGYKLAVNGTLAWGMEAAAYMYGYDGHKVAYTGTTSNIFYSGGVSGFGVNNQADTTRLFQIKDDGNVGINDTTPHLQTRRQRNHQRLHHHRLIRYKIKEEHNTHR
ncbi:MAG: hypothetical protein U9P50_02980, partial [Patescibacteria group bacterium]|nr:hypothetical protein [Patescibacteria group bacterium]